MGCDSMIWDGRSEIDGFVDFFGAEKPGQENIVQRNLQQLLSKKQDTWLLIGQGKLLYHVCFFCQ